MHHSILDKTKGILSHFKDDFVAQRMMSMGVLPGVHIELIRSNPNLGSFYIKANNRNFALREKEAKSLIVI